MVPRGCADAFEESGFRRRTPDLPTSVEPPEKRHSPLRVEMRGDLVEKEDRRSATAIGNEVRVGEHEAEQQGLLLPRRGAASGHGLGAMDDGEVLPVRPFSCATGPLVTHSVAAERGNEVASLPSFERELGPGKVVLRRL